MFTFSKSAKAYVEQKRRYPSLMKDTEVPESVDKAFLPINVFADEVSDMLGLTTYFKCNGKWFKRRNIEVHYMYEYVFEKLVEKVKITRRQNIKRPQGDVWNVCKMLNNKYGIIKLF